MKRRAILWEAVSDPSQAKEGKESIPEQDRLLREAAAREDWEIIDVLVVPGFSRVYYNFPEFAQAAFDENNHDAGLRMMEHWRRRDFDVFACRDGSRFGREQSIFGEVVSRTIDMGGLVYTLENGYVDRQGKRFFIALGGLKAASEVDELNRRREEGMRGRAKRGLPTSPKVPLSHVLIRDPNTGAGLRLEVNERLRALWDDLAAVVLARIPWHEVELRLAAAPYFHTRSDGTPYNVEYFYALLMNPLFWGHSAQHHQYRGQRKTRTRTKRLLPWIWDNAVDPPDGITVYRNTHPAVYTGEQSAHVRAELWRRYSIIKGRRRPYSYRFAGLLVCDECGRPLGLHIKKNNRWRGFRCISRFSKRNPYPCSQRRMISDDKVLEYIDSLLRLYVDSQGSALFEVSGDAYADRRAALQSRVEAARAEMGTLIREQASAPEAAQPYYRAEIARLAAQLQANESELNTLRQQADEIDQRQRDQRAELERIRALTPAAFWEQEEGAINQQLHRAFGNRRLVVRAGEIVGIIPVDMRR